MKKISIDQQEYNVLPSEIFIYIDSKNTIIFQEQFQMLSNNYTLPTASFDFSEELVQLLFLYQINNMLYCTKIKFGYICEHDFVHQILYAIVISHWQRN